MKIPADGTKVHEHALAALWFDKQGILHKVSKNTPRTLDKVEDLYTFIKRATHRKKVCALIEVSNEMASDKKVLDYLKQEIPNVFRSCLSFYHCIRTNGRNYYLGACTLPCSHSCF